MLNGLFVRDEYMLSRGITALLAVIAVVVLVDLPTGDGGVPNGAAIVALLVLELAGYARTLHLLMREDMKREEDAG